MNTFFNFTLLCVGFTLVNSFRSNYQPNSYKRNLLLGEKVKDVFKLNLRLEKAPDTSASVQNSLVVQNQVYSFSELKNVFDFFQVMNLSINEFFPTLSTNADKFKCLIDIVFLFLPKFFAPWIMKHTVIGVKIKNGELVGFVDLSLQTRSGSRVALENLPFSQRSARYTDLSPYLCNFLIAPAHRKKGLGRFLLRLCEERAKAWGYSELFLHVDMKTLAPMKLYLSSNFQPVQMQESSLVFMKKSLK